MNSLIRQWKISEAVAELPPIIFTRCELCLLIKWIFLHIQYTSNLAWMHRQRRRQMTGVADEEKLALALGTNEKINLRLLLATEDARINYNKRCDYLFKCFYYPLFMEEKACTRSNVKRETEIRFKL
ncbi:hypothetical protein SUGI_0227100 [Cryptomeria japonica]|nr:hypothetical protein SUGI_0227100 [Cryptomeria japonica]